MTLEGMGRGLDADPYARQRRMDCRAKPGNDDEVWRSKDFYAELVRLLRGHDKIGP